MIVGYVVWEVIVGWLDQTQSKPVLYEVFFLRHMLPGCVSYVIYYIKIIGGSAQNICGVGGPL